MKSDEITNFAENYTAAWCSADPERVSACFSEHAILYVNAEPASGRNAITDVARGFMTAFPDLELRMDALDLDGDKAIYHWRFIGTNTGPDGTGKAVNFTGSETWTFDADGLVEKSVGSFDNNEYERQLKFGIVKS